MWLQAELLKLQINNLSIRQQLDLLQDNAYVRCNLDHLINTSSVSSLGSTRETSLKDNSSSKYAKDANIAWNNILSYLCLAFPVVWKAIRDSSILPGNTTNLNFSLRLQDTNLGIQSWKKILEVFKTLVYGGSLRPHFSQNRCIQQLHSELLQSCQSSDVPGKDNISGQYRIIFLQNWIEKLVNKSSLSTFLTNHTSLSSPENYIGKKSALVSDSKYIVSKISETKPHPSGIQYNAPSTSSSQTTNTTFSSYINRSNNRSSEFVGIKIKFDSDSSSDSDNTESSDNSLWKPTFKKRKTS